MNKEITELLNTQCDAFGYFAQVFLFGSSLWADVPNDIDILLVYDTTNLEKVNTEKSKIQEILTRKLPHCTLDFTTLSKSELQQTGLLLKVAHMKFKS